MATGPKPSACALEVYKRGEPIEPSVLSRIHGPLWGGLIGLCCSLGQHALIKKPLWAGIQVHIILGGASAAIGKWWDNKLIKWEAQTKAIVLEYIKAHPEDFPRFVRSLKMATGPKVSTSPLELYQKEQIIEPSVLDKYWGALWGGVIGITSMVFGRMLIKKPVWSGIQSYALMGVGSVAAGKWLDDKYAQYESDNRAIIRHYIELHPEDFPPFERKKYGEILLPWTPIR